METTIPAVAASASGTLVDTAMVGGVLVVVVHTPTQLPTGSAGTPKGDFVPGRAQTLEQRAAQPDRMDQQSPFMAKQSDLQQSLEKMLEFQQQQLESLRSLQQTIEQGLTVNRSTTTSSTNVRMTKKDEDDYPPRLFSSEGGDY